MLNLSLAGTLGRDAEYKESQSGKGRCSFSVAVNVGYGEKRTTQWIDVTRWGEGSRGLANLLRKGSKVALSGEMSTREHNGKTYIQCRADHVTIQGTPQGSERREPDGSPGHAGGFGGGFGDDLDDDIPF